MNILLINGSPKGTRSNTYRLAKAFIEGVNEAVPSDCEELTVADMDIKPCLGCFGCWKNGEGRCVINDDMASVLEKMKRTDMIVWSFGLYYFNVPGKLKTLIDRQLPLSMPFMERDSESGGHPSRFDMSGKKHVVISTCGFYTAQGNYQSVNAMFDHFLGKGNYETVFCSQGELFRVPELHDRTDEYLAHVKQAGREFAGSGVTEETRRSLQTLLFPREVFENMADASWGIEKETGNKSDSSLSFTRQMAALYNKNSYTGKDKVLEMCYTDVGKTYQIVMKRDGFEVIEDNFLPYTTKIETPLTVWKDIAAGRISGSEAMVKRMYRVDGDFDMMLHWDQYFGSGSEPVSDTGVSKKKEKGASMLLLLIPWITMWVALSIDSFIGPLVTIGVSALLPLLFIRFRKTAYDIFSAAAVTGISIAALIVPDTVKILLAASYSAFGLMWTFSCLLKVPLTAWYSMKDYNGDSALKNPLFMRTNRILSLAWGLLYILTGVWTYFLYGADFGIYIPIINNIMPILMGIFTKWFQNWYPAHYASK